MTIDSQLLADQVERLSPLSELWAPALEQALGGVARPTELLNLIERDIALTTRVLVVANSELYGKPEQISTLSSALDYLGLDMVQNLILSTPCNTADHLALYGKRISFNQFWKHCLACSVLSERIAEQALPGLTSEAKTAGLLHDVGKLLLNLQEPGLCQKIVPERGHKALQLQEMEAFGITHAEVGHQVFERLRLPNLLQKACGRHHCSWEELNLGEEVDLFTACVILADFLAYQFQLGDGGNLARPLESPPDLSRIGLSESRIQSLTETCLEDLNKIQDSVQPGTLSIDRQFQLLHQATQTLGRRNLCLSKNVTELAQLEEVHDDLNREHRMEDLLQRVALRLGTIFSAEVIAFGLLYREEGYLIHYFSKIPLSEEFLKNCQLYLLQNWQSAEAIELGKQEPQVQLLAPDATGGRFQLKEVRSALRMELPGPEGRPIGRMALFSNMLNAFSQSEKKLAAIISGEVAIALDRAYWMKRTEFLSVTDGQTRLYNHRYFLKALEQEFVRSRRYKTPMCLLMIDIDHFKSYNDTYGHPQGDRMLRAIAELFFQDTRESDICTRYGGEEFAIILPSTDLAGGMTMAERILKTVDEHPFPCPNHAPLHMTVSIGVTEFRGEGIKEFKQIINRADQGLYQAKGQGRNQIVTYERM